MRFVVEVILTAEEQHLMLRQRLIDRGGGFGIELTEAHPVDTRTDVLAQFHHMQIATHGRPFESFIV
jgi:hypothetical protein